MTKNLDKATRVSMLTLGEARAKYSQVAATIQKLKDSAKEGAAGMVEALQSTLPAFDAVQRQSRQTAAHLNANLKDQIREAQRWSTNLQALLKRGADPKFIQALAQKGPEYVAAYVRGSDRQLRTGEILWRRRERAMAAATKDAKEVALAAVQKMVDRMNHKLANLKAQVVALQGKFGWQGLKVFTGGGAPPRAAHGMKVTQGTTSSADDVLIRASKGETVVSAAHSARPEFQAWATAMGIPGFARGGAVLPQWKYSQRDMDKFYAEGTRVFIENLRKFQQAWIKNMLAAGIGGAGVSGIGVPSSRNRSIVHQIFASMFNWTGAQLAATDQLLMHESGYRNTAQNPTSTAYGMFQFLNSTWAGTGIAKTSDPTRQAVAGGRYISSRYGSPIGAWNFWQAHHWYHQGGTLPEDIMGVGRSGRTYGFQGGETVTARGGNTYGGNTYNVTITGPVYGTDADMLAANIESAIARRARDRGHRNVGTYLNGLRT
jgi:hypothetical protein